MYTELMKLITDKQRRFNLSPEEYFWLFSLSREVCALCKEPETVVTRQGVARALSIDHDHSCCTESGTSCGYCVRGLLCASCNFLIGFAEKKSRVRKLLSKDVLKYLKQRPITALRAIRGDEAARNFLKIEERWKMHLFFAFAYQRFQKDRPNWMAEADKGLYRNMRQNEKIKFMLIGAS
jgi:hypothetical protein